MKRIIVHLHLYYLDQTDMLIEKLNNIKNLCNLDLIVTMREKNPDIESKIKTSFPNAKIIMVKNVGADIWPFIVMLNSVNLDDYDYLVKIHTKRFVKVRNSRMPETKLKTTGLKWRDYLLDFFKPKNFIKCLNSFKTDKKLGMVSSYPVIFKDFEKYGEGNPTCLKTRDLLNKLNYKTKISYVSGTIFMARAKLFNVVKNLRFKESDFGEFESGISNQLPHVMEQLLCSCVLGQGYEIRDVFTSRNKIIIQKLLVKPYLVLNNILRKSIKTILRFFVKIRREKNQNRIIGIRILKIWVWKEKK